MGYDQSQLDQQKNGDTIAEGLTGMPDGSNAGFPELQSAYEADGESSYENFLKKLEANVAGSLLNHPLASCKRFFYAYLQSRGNGADVTATIDTVKGTLVNLSASGHGSNTNDFSPLTNRIKTLLSKIRSLDPNSASSPLPPSPVPSPL
ncbi:chemotaxis protein CheA [Babesia caballi]|uniref:Chemotaxis protein CheA n=1 Tax=Babesia caballi TaxID=5871 RepID=A0AAV4LUA7_BABCB|nr:chemotaxis protein CheA [Babesia caballi]